MLRYYDQEEGKFRIKRRYVWALWSFLAGSAFGLTLAYLL